MSSAEAAPGSGVQTIDRVTAILGTFSGRKPALGVTEIATATGLSTSTAHRLLAALQHNGLVRQTADRRYVLGPLLLRLAHVAATHAGLRDAALPAMRELRDRVEDTVGLHELVDDRDRITIAQAESRLALRRTYTDLGSPIPLPQGAPGKVLLAFLPVEVQETVLAAPLARVTPETIIDRDVIRAQLADIRRTGYAISLGERTRGIRSVAAPIWDHTGHPVACLSISAPELRMPTTRCHELGELVKQAGWEVSASLGATDAAVAATRHESTVGSEP